MSVDDLALVLVEDALRAVDHGTGPLPFRALSATGAAFNRHWLDWSVASALLGILVWATGLVATLPGFQPATIAVRNLEAGSSVRPDDVVVWPVIAADEHFSTPGELDDIVLTRSVARGLPITRPDVLRLQVVAARDIAAETLLERNGVSLAWSPYRSGALLHIEDVERRVVHHALKMGDVVLASSIDTSAASRAQVVVQVQEGLAPLHIIKADDVRLWNTPVLADAFERVDQVAGRYVTQRVLAGSTLRADDVSSSLAPSSQALRISIPAAALGAGVTSPGSVNVAFVPRDRGPSSPGPRILSDVALTGADARPDGGSTLTIQLDSGVLESVLPLLGASDVFVFKAV